jgi:hypothetical protein
MFSNRTTTLPGRAERRLLIVAAVVGLLTLTAIRMLPGLAFSTGSSAGRETGLPGPQTLAAAGASEANIRTLVDDVLAARDRHDRRSSAAFTRQLSALVGPAAVRDVDIAYRTVLTNIAAALEQHDRRALARFRVELAGLCRPGSITSALEPCDAHQR